jgi:hypothetical protein
MAGAIDERIKLEEEKLQLIKQREKLEAEREERARDNLAEAERIGEEIKQIHARIAELDKKLIATALRVE